MALRSINSIYTYSDYRKYLSDYFTARKKADNSFSHRVMAREFGFSTPNFTKQVIDGQRNVGLRSLERFNKALRFKHLERKYFSNLVFFCQAKKPAEKIFYLGQLTASRPKAKVGHIAPDEYQYYNEWYHCVVRELIVRESPPVNYERIANKIQPQITAAQVEKSVDLLCKLGMIKKKARGKYVQSSRIISTAREVTSLGIRNYHAKMMELGKDSMDAVEQKKREISSLSLCISSSNRDRIKKRIQKIQSEILQMAYEDPNASEVYQLNFQFFPLTKGEE